MPADESDERADHRERDEIRDEKTEDQEANGARRDLVPRQTRGGAGGELRDFENGHPDHHRDRHKERELRRRLVRDAQGAPAEQTRPAARGAGYDRERLKEPDSERPPAPAWNLVSSSIPCTATDETLLFSFPLPPHSSKTVTYRIRLPAPR